MYLNDNERFEELVNNVGIKPTDNLMESISIKTPTRKAPLHEARAEIEAKNTAKKVSKAKAKEALKEASEAISTLYTKYVLEGVLSDAGHLHPELNAKIGELQIALAEAASSAKEFLD